MLSSSPYFANGGNGSAPLIVQGQRVHIPTAGNQHPTYQQNPSSAVVSNVDYRPAPLELTGDDSQRFKGELQPRQCRDAFWAILFYLHIGLITFCTIQFVPSMIQDVGEEYVSGEAGGGGGDDVVGRQRRLAILQRFLQDDNNDADETDFSIDPQAIMIILAVAGLAGFLLSSLAMAFMMRFAEGLIKMALIFNLVMVATMMILSLLAGVVVMAAMFGIGCLFSIYYCYVVWSKIPFAASNLITATTAVQANMGLAFFAYTNLIVTFLWSFWWSLAFISTSYVLGACDGQGNCDNEINGGLVFLFLVSFFWTAQVIKNVVHTTVAGTVGTFWFAPHEANGCCSKGVRDSYWRSITTSFGSICFGSLIVAIIQATKEIVRSIREQHDSLLVCLADCILGCIESLVEYFNQWAYVYVGLYGYSFLEAGTNVMALFRARGWTSIIADMLVDTVLLMVSLGVGLLTGIVGVLVGSIIQQDDVTLIGAFFIGMIIGVVLCSTLFSLISSAVNATIVLYAEAPAEFQANHPQLSEQMRAAWKQAYPTEFRY